MVAMVMIAHETGMMWLAKAMRGDDSDGVSAGHSSKAGIVASKVAARTSWW